MKVTRVETRCVTVKLDKPIGSALGQLHSFGCILVFVHCDSGIVGENLVFTLNARRTRVLRSMVEAHAAPLELCVAYYGARRATRPTRDEPRADRAARFTSRVD